MLGSEGHVGRSPVRDGDGADTWCNHFFHSNHVCVFPIWLAGPPFLGFLRGSSTRALSRRKSSAPRTRSSRSTSRWSSATAPSSRPSRRTLSRPRCGPSVCALTCLTCWYISRAGGASFARLLKVCPFEDQCGCEMMTLWGDAFPASCWCFGRQASPTFTA